MLGKTTRRRCVFFPNFCFSYISTCGILVFENNADQEGSDSFKIISFAVGAYADLEIATEYLISLSSLILCIMLLMFSYFQVHCYISCPKLLALICFSSMN